MLKRRRFKQTVPFTERLATWARGIREEAEKLPSDSPQRALMLKKARQADTASHLDDWANSPGLQPPT
jgi:hypothetical protein